MNQTRPFATLRTQQSDPRGVLLHQVAVPESSIKYWGAYGEMDLGRHSSFQMKWTRLGLSFRFIVGTVSTPNTSQASRAASPDEPTLLVCVHDLNLLSFAQSWRTNIGGSLNSSIQSHLNSSWQLQFEAVVRMVLGYIRVKLQL